ncbi:MAG: DegT/DnrJ/EryC1/StrS aminotransferase family protein [Oligoflexia bacterium]|nr:DegT/DnrJ/EryC1/StrS aminotransferase family protein [Oligoflexia bacterium]
MQNNITRADLDAVIEFLKGEPILTNSKKCREFEEQWSSWLGVKYSVFVNSGASANIMTMAVLKELYGEGEIITPPLTWISDIVAVTKAGFTPVFVDINPRNLCMDEEQVIRAITPRTKAVFLTHVLGFNGLSDRLLKVLRERNIPLVEDVCESHGATYKGKKLGSYGLVSNFSFYFAHHLSTIEGGMVCTDDEHLYQMVRMFRSHGMVREVTNDALRAKYAKENPDLRPEFIFAYPGFNFRSTEINAVIGLSQLPRLDTNNEVRRRNFALFLELLDKDKYFTEFDCEGSCNYAFVLVLRKPDTAFCDRVISALKAANVEFRRGTAGGGNHLRQPYLKRMLGEQDLGKFPQVEHVHFFGFYIGNFPTLEESRVRELCALLNSIG